jgi:uncharacterized surface protein with fasciclin (FAS1) repeats
MSKFTATVSGLLTLAVAIGLLAAPAIASDCSGSKATQTASKQMDIVDTAVAAGNFSTLVKAVEAAGLVDTLKSDGPWTVFAPTDEAFAAIPSETLTALIANKDQLTQVLTYHVVAGEVTSAQVVELDSAETVQGQSLTIDTSSGVKVDNANVIKTDIQCSNGVIHVIDAVVLPS